MFFFYLSLPTAPNYRGLAKVKVQVALIFSCLNLKKLAKRKLQDFIFSSLSAFITESQNKKPASGYSETGFVYSLSLFIFI